MDVIHYLPSSSELNAGAFRKWGTREDSVRVGISAPHTVSGSVGATTLEGTADITYVIEANKKYDSLAGSLEVKQHTQYVGTQSPDVIRSLMEDLRPRTSYAVHTTVNGVFDLRGLIFVCGRLAAGGAANAEFEYGKLVSQTRLLSPTWTVPVTGELVIGPGVASTQNEFATLACMTRAAGMRTVQLMGDLLPPEGRVLQGTKLSAFALKLAAAILSVSQGCACGTHHLLAFYRGMVSAWKLWAHTDEGGWLRDAMANPQYPPGAGIISVTQSEFMGLPLKQRMHESETTRACAALFLTMATAIPIADAYYTGDPTVFSRDVSGTGRPSEYEGLIDRTYEVMHVWRYLMSKKFSLHESSIGDGHSFGPFFSSNKVDSHFAERFIIPFWTNEPSPVYTGDLGNVIAPIMRGETVDLPLFGAESVAYQESYSLHDGRLSRGAKAVFTLPSGGLRTRGFSYLLSGVYNSSNGLSFMEYVKDYEVGVLTTDGAFVAEGITNAAARRWMTPHNPMVNPLEGYRGERSALEYSYAGRRSDPKISDFSTATVKSTVGPFFLTHDPGAPSARTHHYVPPRYERSLRMFEAAYNPKEALTRRFFNEANEDPTLRGRVVEPPMMEDPITDRPPEGEPVKHVEPPEAPPSLPPGQEAQVALVDNAGLRQPTKTAAFETVNPRGGNTEAT